MERFFKKIIFILSLLIFPFFLHAQESPTIKKRKKELAEKNEEQKNEDEAFLKQMQKRHKKNQSKETRKRMKKKQINIEQK